MVGNDLKDTSVANSLDSKDEATLNLDDNGKLDIQATHQLNPDRSDQKLHSEAGKLNHLKEFVETHQLDPNLPLEELAEIEEILTSGNIEKGIKTEKAYLEDDSPYPEVRLSINFYEL